MRLSARFRSVNAVSASRAVPTRSTWLRATNSVVRFGRLDNPRSVVRRLSFKNSDSSCCSVSRPSTTRIWLESRSRCRSFVQCSRFSIRFTLHSRTHSFSRFGQCWKPASFVTMGIWTKQTSVRLEKWLTTSQRMRKAWNASRLVTVCGLL